MDDMDDRHDMAELEHRVLSMYRMSPLDIAFAPGSCEADIWLPGPKMCRRPKHLRTPGWMRAKAKRNARRAARRRNRA